VEDDGVVVGEEEGVAKEAVGGGVLASLSFAFLGFWTGGLLGVFTVRGAFTF